MTSRFSSRAGGRILVDALQVHGVSNVFCVPGESYLPVLDALYDKSGTIRLTVCRQEGGAAFMAAAYGKLTGRPGVSFVTRAPGACNASIGVHAAHQDSAPLVLFVGQVGTGALEREAFQEIDYRRMYGGFSKWVAQIDRTDRIPEMVSHAFHVAASGRPGPVVLALPEDILRNQAEVADTRPYVSVQAHPGQEDIERMLDLLESAGRPLMILDGGGWDRPACEDIQTFAGRAGLPAVAGFRGQDLFDNRHECYVGDMSAGINPKLAQRIMEADLLLVIGARLGEMSTRGYTLVAPPCPTQRLVHVYNDANELGKVFQPDIPICSGMRQFGAALRMVRSVDGSRWRDWARSAREDYLENVRPISMPGALNLSEAMADLSAVLPRDAILCVGSGNFTGWVHRFYQFSGFRTQLSPAAGAMGYAVPAAIAAKLACPQRVVISVSGDGCFLMNGQELATAVSNRLPIVFMVVNNGMYGTIRMHQERHYPGRVSGTELHNPDFVALARSYGAEAEVVRSTAEFKPAVERALGRSLPTLLELEAAPEAITTRATLTEIREDAMKRLR